MSTLDEKRQNFEHRLEELKQASQTEPTSVTAAAPQNERESPVDQDEGLSQRISDWEAQLDHRLAEFQGRDGEEKETSSSPEPAPSVATAEPAPPLRISPKKRPFSRGAQATLQTWLHNVDTMMLDELKLGRFPLPDGFTGEVQLFDNDQAMIHAILEACQVRTDVGVDLSLPEHAMGVCHIPGRGTLLNLQHYLKSRGGGAFDNTDLELRAHLASDLARERWGWGYLFEYTLLGKQAAQAGLWPRLLADRLKLAPAQPLPDETLPWSLVNAVHKTWTFTAQGWGDWVWQFVMFKARHPLGERLIQRPRTGRWLEMVGKIVNLFPLFITPYGVRMRLLGVMDLVRFLFLEQSEMAPRTLNAVLSATQDLCRTHDQAIQKALGYSLSQVLGRLYYAQLEAHVGILCTPYATLLAGHIPDFLPAATERLEQPGSEERSDPWQDVDTRLAMLTNLDSRVKYDPKAMFIAAWERLRLDGPQEFFV